MADHEHNDFFDALDNAKEHLSDMAMMEDSLSPRQCKLHNREHSYVRHSCGHEYCPHYWRACPRCYGTHDGNRFDAPAGS